MVYSQTCFGVKLTRDWLSDLFASQFDSFEVKLTRDWLSNMFGSQTCLVVKLTRDWMTSDDLLTLENGPESVISIYSLGPPVTRL